MQDSLFKMFGSVRLVQEVSRSTTSSSAAVAPSVTPSSETQLSIDTSSRSATASFHTTSEQQPLIRSAEPSAHSSYWPPHSVQPIPFSFNNYTPATPSLPLWMSSYNNHKPVRGIIRNLFFGSSPSSSTPPSPTRPHARKNSRHTRRARSSSKLVLTGRRRSLVLARQPKASADGKGKSKSQKLLCLWPLPIITRYIIAISLLVSGLNFFHILRVSCSSPSFVIHRLEIGNLLLSPFLFNWSLQGILLFGWNVLILGLFEESLTHMLGGTRRFVQVLVGNMLAVSILRQGLGYLFSKSTGWAVPILFFSDSVHECNEGFAPFLFALLVVQSLSIDDKYIMIYGDEDSNNKVTVRKVTLQLLMCLVNYTTKNILWWSLSGLLTGYLASVGIQMCLLRERRDDDDNNWDEKSPSLALEDSRRPTPLWRLVLSAIKKGAVVVALTLLVLLMFNGYYYSRKGLVDPAVLNQLSQDRYMFTFVVMTAPRRGDPPLLSRTLDSYLANWPVDPAPGSLYSRIQAIVYTHFTNHSQYDIAKDRLSNDLKGQRYLKWVREEGNQMNQRLHVSKALRLAADNFQSTYIGLLEDDFPVCGGNEWREIENVVYEANEHVPSHCGVFVGTGGSGLFLKPEIARLASDLLLQYSNTPPDIVIQKCLRGDLPECSQCKESLVTSKTLLMYHIGFNTSTSQDRIYKKDEFQCKWRHPFNGDPAVITL